eukprot:CAMPEP_0197023760 /NCGR_PEP_ID=MMETSP1384-20130603/4405_1 /TAXON_ID=29189 /ORGANISM="Ammonia sp." /LENGTH=276 /DNA_ID=CAMNT_0042452023 /DNA_START=37 /DNA_END=864 /DNA_ORIENTATION=+
MAAKNAVGGQIYNDYVRAWANEGSSLLSKETEQMGRSADYHVHKWDAMWRKCDESKLQIKHPGGLWPDGIIPYEIEIKDFELSSMVERAVKKFNDKITNVRWQPRAYEWSYVAFVRDDTQNPHSNVGCILNKQQISLCKTWPNSQGQKILLGNILHEMGHAIGFQHTHQMPQRDDYVTVKGDMGCNSDRVNYLARAEYGFGDYDLDSIMHYPESTKIRAKVMHCGKIGQRADFSENDLKIFNKLYEATSRERRAREQEMERKKKAEQQKKKKPKKA